MSGDEFDWTNDETVVVGAQAAIAVYLNNECSVVVGQQGDWQHEEDTYVVIQEAFAELVARRIMELLNVRPDAVAVSHRPSADPTAAERQRKHRGRQRNVTGSERDTDRDVTGVHRDGHDVDADRDLLANVGT